MNLIVKIDNQVWKKNNFLLLKEKIYSLIMADLQHGWFVALISNAIII